jgi:eukaryotic-like serine/threonine-protein kinase
MASRIFLGRYETVRLLGEGGMGRVYLARQTDLGRQVVVKVMHDHIANDPKFRERFQREMLLMARFQHPYVVALYDASLSDPHGPCIIMEYIKGVSLDTLIHRNGRLTPARVGRLLAQLCEALYAAHSEGIAHRDLKPAHLMVVDPDTPYEKIKVMDFGLAKLVEDAAGMGMFHKAAETGVDFAVGTPGYISPEQVRGEHVDYRCDIYSVGVLLFELLTGRLPFTRDETMDVLFAHATEAPPSFAEVGAVWVPPEVERVVLRCLAKSPNERPSSARDLAQEFQEALLQAEDHPEPPLSAVPPAPPPSSLERADTPTQVLPPPSSALQPGVVIHQMEAWMPDAIASYKLRGFVQDHDGQVLESAPGRIRVRLGAPPAGSGSGAFAWFGLRRRDTTLDIELRLERSNPLQQNQLLITVLMSSPDVKGPGTAAWREHCGKIYCDLRAHLAAASVTT